MFLVSTNPRAGSWTVRLNIPGLEPEPAPRVDPGSWLNPYHQLRVNEVAWEAGLFFGHPAGTVVVITQPESSKPVRLPHPGADDVDMLGLDGETMAFEL